MKMWRWGEKITHVEAGNFDIVGHSKEDNE